MIPGPDQIIACPKCKGLAKYRTIVSGNTFGATLWSDGKQVAPMLPVPPAVVKCRHCGEYYWLADAEEVGMVEQWNGEDHQIKPEWTSAKEVIEPTEDEYYLALESSLVTNPQEERNLRILAWWRSNDDFRNDYDEKDRQQTSMTEQRRKNLEGLVCLLHEDDLSDAIMKAEVLRELGEFESASKVLSSIDDSELTNIVRQLQYLVDEQDSRVRELRTY